MASLACTTVLLDTWGPRTYGLLLHGTTAPPLHAMALFNLGDLLGVIVSVALVDRLGRRGCFAIGFHMQAGLLLLFVRGAHTMSLEGLTLIGVLASGTRCFAWEAAHLWVAEAFPTRVRVTVLAMAIVVMRLASAVTVSVSGSLIEAAEPSAVLSTIAGLQLICGTFAVAALPKETAGLGM